MGSKELMVLGLNAEPSIEIESSSLVISTNVMLGGYADSSSSNVVAVQPAQPEVPWKRKFVSSILLCILTIGFVMVL